MFNDPRLRGSETRTLSTVSAFRFVSAREAASLAGGAALTRPSHRDHLF